MSITIDLYNRRTMLRALEQMKPARTFLLNTFFNFGSAMSHDTDTIDIDVYKGKRRMAEFINPKMQSKTVESRGYTTRTYKPGYIKHKKVTNAEDILKRQIGQAMIYGTGMSPAAYAQQQVGKDLAELREMITRRIEWMASKLLQSGVVTISGDGEESRTIDFGMDANHIITLSGVNLWTNVASDPFKDVRTWKRLVSKDCGILPNICIMGSDAMDTWLQNTKVKAGLDNRRIELGKVAPRDLGEGVTYYATVEGVEYYEYNEYYYDTGSSTDLPMVPVDGVILGSTSAYTSTHFGVIKDLDANAAVPYFPKTWTKEDPSVRYLMLQSSPMPALHQSDAFIYATVI